MDLDAGLSIRATARSSFILFLLAFTASAFSVLVPSPEFWPGRPLAACLVGYAFILLLTLPRPQVRALEKIETLHGVHRSSPV